MTGATWVWTTAAASVAMILLLILRSGLRDILPFVAAYFLYFGLGPSINYALGNPIYVGIMTDRIGQSAMGLLLALVGLTAVGLFIPIRSTALDRARLDQAGGSNSASGLLWLLALYAVVIVVSRGPGMVGGSKLARIAAAGPFHYPYLLSEICACALYFVASRTPNGRVAYRVNMVCYVGYCLLTDERDFIFVLLSVLLHIQLFRARTMSRRLVLICIGLGAAGTYLAALRGGRGTALVQALNQGSTTFVDTFVMNLFPVSMPFRDGATYVHALTGIIPFWSGAKEPTLTSWFVGTYAPGGNSGYGFSLTAEAYLNFGTLGIPVVFAVLAAVQRLLVNRVDRSDFYAYLSVLFTASWMYSFRGESATLLKTLMYGSLLFAGVHLTSALQRRLHNVVPQSRVSRT